MHELIFKKIEKKDERQLRELINIVLGGLENPEFFIPYAEWEMQRMFDENYAPLHGAYDGDKLAGMAQLYIEQDMIKEYKEVLGLDNFKVCELGGNLVLPKYRGQGITYTLMKMQCHIAKELGFDYIITMAHPDNIGSNKAITKVGLEYVKTTKVNDTFLRNIYCMKI